MGFESDILAVARELGTGDKAPHGSDKILFAWDYDVFKAGTIRNWEILSAYAHDRRIKIVKCSFDD